MEDRQLLREGDKKSGDTASDLSRENSQRSVSLVNTPVSGMRAQTPSAKVDLERPLQVGRDPSSTSNLDPAAWTMQVNPEHFPKAAAEPEEWEQVQTS